METSSQCHYYRDDRLNSIDCFSAVADRDTFYPHVPFVANTDFLTTGTGAVIGIRVVGIAMLFCFVILVLRFLACLRSAESDEALDVTPCSNMVRIT
jgi:hypothetical protein